LLRSRRRYGGIRPCRVHRVTTWALCQHGGTHMSKVVAPPLASPAHATPSVSHDRIALRAYEKWCLRGYPPGTDLKDWLEAEAELRKETMKHTSTPARR